MREQQADPLFRSPSIPHKKRFVKWNSQNPT